MPNTWLLGHNHGNRNNGVYTSRTESETLLCTKSAFKKLFLFLTLEHFTIVAWLVSIFEINKRVEQSERYCGQFLSRPEDIYEIFSIDQVRE